MFSLKNKVAVITGSEGGIGKAIVKGFLEAGALTYELDIKNGIDITNYRDVEFELKRDMFDHVDILVNCAGITIRNKSETYSLEDWQRTIKVNLEAPFKLCQLMFPYMKNEGGSIINITSVWSEIVLENNPAYGASKGGLKQLTKCLANDWAKYNIRVNNIGLGYFKTNMTKGSWNNHKKRKERISRIPLNRAGYPEDVIGASIFLASNASKYITGIDLYIDGVWLINGL